MAKRKVILVDDQAAYRKILHNILKRIDNVEVVAEASDAYEFLSLLDTVTADIVFIDIEMEGLNGIDATEKALKKQGHLVIIGLSMYENENYITGMIEAGGKGYLLKLKNNIPLFEKIVKNPRSEFYLSEGIKYEIEQEEGQVTILTVDDFESNTFIVASALQNAGYKIIKAHSGEEALKLSKENEIDMLITDFKMPGMNGVELTKRIRNIPEYKNIPVLVLSSQKDEALKKQAREAGITGWVQKPYDLKRFLQIIENALA